jgi:hypothetical protein
MGLLEQQACPLIRLNTLKKVIVIVLFLLLALHKTAVPIGR